MTTPKPKVCDAVIYIMADDPFCAAALHCTRRPHKTGLHRHDCAPREVSDLYDEIRYKVVYWKATTGNSTYIPA